MGASCLLHAIADSFRASSQVEAIAKAQGILAEIEGGEALLRGLSDACGVKRITFAQVIDALSDEGAGAVHSKLREGCSLRDA